MSPRSIRIYFLAALLLALLPAAALAQSAPAKLPANSVFGRLGIPGDTGPGQAIPLTTLGNKLSAALSGGVAKMFPHLAQTTSASDCYTLIDPYGNPIACTTSTTTQGLQEFLNATAANGWPAIADCQGVVFPSKTQPVFIEATTSVTVPVAQDWSFHSYGCNLNFNVTTVSGLIIDSEGASVFDWDGKIVYNVTSPNGNVTINPSCAVLIQPTTNTADGFAGLYAGYFRVKTPVANPVSGNTTGVICINTSSGSIIQQRLDFTEVNANNDTYFGLVAFGATASFGLQQTEININQVHGAILHGIDIGFNGTNQANYNGNQWKVNNIEQASTANTSRCVDTWGSSDTFDIGVCNGAQGGLGIGLLTESGASYNKFRYGSITGWSTLDWQDGGTCNEFSGGSGASGGAGGTQAVYVGGTSGCTKVVASAAAGGKQTWPNATGNIGATGWAELKPYPSQGSGAWHATDPYGNDISTSGTTCQGFDKLVAAASTNGWSWRVVGNGSISCTAPVSLPTCFFKSELIDTGVTISWSAQTSSNLLTINSHENCDSNFLGSFVQHSGDTGAVVDLAPTSNDGAGNTVFAASNIVLNSIAPASGGIGVKLDPTSGSFVGNTFTIVDVNGGATGIQIANPGSGSIVVEQNKFFLTYNHGQTTRVVQIGTSSTNQAGLRYNVWHPGRIDPNAATVAWDSWASNDTYIGLTIDNETAAATTGLKFETGACGNTVIGGVIQATIALSDVCGTTPGNVYLGVKGVTSMLWNVICKNLTPAGTGADTTVDTLQSCSIPANTLNSNGNRIKIVAYGTYGADGNNKTITATFGGTSIYNSGTITQNGTGWRFEAEVWRTGSSTQRYSGSGLQAGFSMVGINSGTASETDTAAITVAIKGQNGTAVANDIVCNAMFVDFFN
jgi:hypothetical protein